MGDCLPPRSDSEQLRGNFWPVVEDLIQLPAHPKGMRGATDYTERKCVIRSGGNHCAFRGGTECVMVSPQQVRALQRRIDEMERRRICKRA